MTPTTSPLRAAAPAAMAAAALLLALATPAAALAAPRHGRSRHATERSAPTRAPSYVSAPGLHPAPVAVTVDRGHTAPGLIFIDPFPSSAKPIVGEAGPEILESNGDPVWFHAVPKGEEAADFTAQRLGGKPVLTWWQGHIAVPPLFTNLPEGSPEPGARFYIYNDHYQRMKTLPAHGTCPQTHCWTADLHEFRITPRGTALFIAAKTMKLNLTLYGGPTSGQLEDFEVQEVSLKTGRLLFEWDMLRHVSPAESDTTPPAEGIWDPYHLNSVTEYGPNHLLVSARNTSAVYDIERKTGNVVWQLGGKESTFSLPSGGHFSWQHDAQPLPGHEVSIFDDACCNILPGGHLAAPQGHARGLVLKLNLSKHTATVVHQYLHNPALFVPSQGNLQTLPGGNVLVGWGQLPWLSEYTASGKLIYDARLPEPDESYRAFKLPWSGMPRTKPSVVARRHGARTTVYVSWNGASQVRSWEVFAGKNAKALEASIRAGKVVSFQQRRGFQTAIGVSVGGPLFRVEAFGPRKRSLGFSPIVRAGAKGPSSIYGRDRRAGGRRASRIAFKGASAVAQSDHVSSGAVAVRVACPAGTYRHCLVNLTLKTAGPIRVGSRSQVLTLGNGSATIAPGKTAVIRVKLTSQARQALKQSHGKLQSSAVVASRDGHGHRATKTRRVTVEEAGGKREEVSSLY